MILSPKRFSLERVLHYIARRRSCKSEVLWNAIIATEAASTIGKEKGFLIVLIDMGRR